VEVRKSQLVKAEKNRRAHTHNKRALTSPRTASMSPKRWTHSQAKTRVLDRQH
jgi:hypothetical protein